MPVAAFAPIIGGALGLGGSLFGASQTSNAAKNAAQLQYQSGQNALDFQKQVWNQEQQNQAPYLQAGEQGLSQLMNALPDLLKGFDPSTAGLPATYGAFSAPAPFHYGASDFQADPGYQFALEQAQQAIQRSAAAKGSVLSGGTLKALTDYTTGAASQQYGAAYQRAQGTYQQNYADAANTYGTNLNTYLQNYGNAFKTFETNQGNTFSRLAGVAGLGQSAANSLDQAGQNFAKTSGDISMGQGNALASGVMGSANAWNAGLGGGINALNGGISQYATSQSPEQQYYAQLTEMLKARGASGYGGLTFTSSPATSPATSPASTGAWGPPPEGTGGQY